MADFSRNFRIGDSHGDRNDINSEGVRFCGACYVCTDGDKLSCLSKDVYLRLSISHFKKFLQARYTGVR